MIEFENISTIDRDEDDLPHGNKTRVLINWILNSKISLSSLDGFYYIDGKLIGNYKRLIKLFNKQRFKTKF